MDFPCSVDGETLSRFVDGELPLADYREVRAHLTSCASCTLRVSRFRLADRAVSGVPVTFISTSHPGRLVASLAVAAALLASLATNVLLTPRDQDEPLRGLKLSAAPSETLASFYEAVVPPKARP